MILKKTILLAALVSNYSLAQNGARTGSLQDFTSPQADVQGVVGESFDDIATLTTWTIDNQSNPIGTGDWFQGNDAVFPAQAGAPTAYMATNFNSTAGSGTICNWLVLPDLGFLQSVSFWTRTTTGNTFPDRMMLLHSPTGGTTTGNCDGGFGDFSDTVAAVNPSLTTGGYPQDWTQFSGNINSTGRLAFVYYVTDGGPAGSNSNYIGIDSVEWVAGAPDADLALSVTNNANGTVAAGTSVTFTQVITNNGPGAANNTVVNGALSAGLTYVSDTCGAGSNLAWNVGTLANGAAQSCDVVATVDGFGSMSYSASASADETDTVASNNNGNSGVNGPARIIPTLSQYGLFLMLFGLIFVARRKIAK
jgi:uncharacterized repeat protein (TIGR01451 family)